jgi:uncharacterized protein (TIGR00730 family)
MRISVYCGSSRRSPQKHLALARAVGIAIARRGHTLVYGGGKTGLMGAVADAVLEGGGRVEGVILDVFIDQGVHHEGLDELHVVTDMRSRKQGLDERADAFLALPGGLGTLEELAEILSFRKLALHHRSLVLLNAEGYYDPLLEQLERGIEHDFDKPTIREFYRVAGTPEEALRMCEEAGGVSAGS